MGLELIDLTEPARCPEFLVFKASDVCGVPSVSFPCWTSVCPAPEPAGHAAVHTHVHSKSQSGHRQPAPESRGDDSSLLSHVPQPPPLVRRTPARAPGALTHCRDGPFAPRPYPPPSLRSRGAGEHRACLPQTPVVVSHLLPFPGPPNMSARVVPPDPPRPAALPLLSFK